MSRISATCASVSCGRARSRRRSSTLSMGGRGIRGGRFVRGGHLGGTSVRASLGTVTCGSWSPADAALELAQGVEEQHRRDEDAVVAPVDAQERVQVLGGLEPEEGAAGADALGADQWRAHAEQVA